MAQPAITAKPHWSDGVKGVVVFSIAMIFTGCVSLSTNRKQISAAYTKGLERAAAFMQRYNCNDAKRMVGAEISGAELQEINR